MSQINSVQLVLEVYHDFDRRPERVVLPLYTDKTDPIFALAEARWLAHDKEMEAQEIAKGEQMPFSF